MRLCKGVKTLGQRCEKERALQLRGIFNDRFPLLADTLREEEVFGPESVKDGFEELYYSENLRGRRFGAIGEVVKLVAHGAIVAASDVVARGLIAVQVVIVAHLGTVAHGDVTGRSKLMK